MLDPQHRGGQGPVEAAGSGSLRNSGRKRDLLRGRVFVRLVLDDGQIFSDVDASSAEGVGVVLRPDSAVLGRVAGRVPAHRAAREVERAANLERLSGSQPELTVLLDDGVRRDGELRRALAAARVWRRQASVSRVVVFIVGGLVLVGPVTLLPVCGQPSLR